MANTMTRRPSPVRCRHRSRSFYERACFVTGKFGLSRRCDDCNAYFSLGPANDAPPEVQQEIRAAEIAADGPSSTLYECLGWADRNAHDRGEPYPGARKPIRIQRNAQWHAGYLARAIVEHDGDDQ